MHQPSSPTQCERHTVSSCAVGVLPFFFFFQAEDGIRDLTVTGVQTCALPISEGLGFTACDSKQWLGHRGTVGKVLLGDLHILNENMQPCPVGTSGTVWFKTARSEERRVGKEGRSRWSPYH